MRVLLIANDVASSVTPRTRVVIAKALAADHKVEVAKTSHRGDATDLARDAVADGFEAVVVLGGDGTLNEAACGVIGTDVCLGVLPGGSTNVYARTIGMAEDPVEATGQLLSALGEPGQRRRRISVGELNSRPFLFHAGVGFDAAVVARVEQRSTIKRWAGHPLFVWSAFATWGNYDRTHRFTVESEGSDGLSCAFAVAVNSDPYTFLGKRPLHIARGADFNKGLSLVGFKRLGLASTMLAAAQALFLPGGLTSGGAVSRVDHLTNMTIQSAKPVPYQVDGDYLGEASEFNISHHPNALDIIDPRPSGS